MIEQLVQRCADESRLGARIGLRRGDPFGDRHLPAIEGLFGMPTVVNNVLTLAAVPWIMANEPQAYADLGMGRSRGTMPIQIAGNVALLVVLLALAMLRILTH